MRVFRALPEGARQRAVRTVAPSYTLGAQARVVRSDGRVLLVKAAYRWSWGMPGGLMDPGEGPAEAAIRETAEETGLAIELIGEPVIVLETEMQRVNFIYQAVPAEGADPDAIEPQASEILELGWFAHDEFPNTIPDESGMVMLELADPDVAPRLVVTNSLEDGSDGAT